MDLTEEDKKEAIRLLEKKKAESKDPEKKISKSDLEEIANEVVLKKLGKKIDGKSSDDESSSELSTHAREIHMSNVLIIHKMIDKVEKNVIDGEDEVFDSIHIEMPDLDYCDFSLGDKVVIDMSKGRFKFIQEQTLGWRKVQSNLLGQIGFISDLRSKYDCKAQVYFPNILTSTAIYIGVLTKTEQDLPTIPSRWKVGDYVKTMRNASLVEKFQKRLPDLPEKHIGKTGRVIAVTSAGIFTTFNEKSSYSLNPGLLHHSENTTPITPKVVTDHPKDFKVGDRVRILSDIPTLIDNQKDTGGWNWRMCSLAGNIVTICHIKKDGSLIVRKKDRRPWRLSYESAFVDSDATRLKDVTFVDDLPFLPGDLVRLKLSKNINVQLLGVKVLESCIDLLKSTAVVEGIDKSFKVVIRFNNGKKRTVKPTMIAKVSKSAERQYRKMKELRESLKAGDMVRLAVGPKRYAWDILSKIKPSKETIDAITLESKLLGYVDEHHAIIRYDDGRKIRMNRKYLEPAGIRLDRFPQKLNFNCLRILVESLQSSIAAAKLADTEESHAKVEESVDIFSVTSGTPPTVCIRIDSTEIQDKILINLKEFTGWTISDVSHNECSIQTTDGIEFDLVLIPETSEYTCKKVDCIMELLKKEEKEVEHSEKISHVTPKSDVKAEPTAFARQNSRVEQRNSAPSSVPLPHSWEEFRFLTFHTAGGALYFPYIPDTSPEFPLPHVDSQPRGQLPNNINTNIIIQGNVASVNQNI